MSILNARPLSLNPSNSAVAVSCFDHRIEKRYAEIECLMHERDCFALGEMSSPSGGNRPQTKTDLADHEIGIFVSTKPHSVMFTAEFAEVTDEITISVSWIRILCGEIHA